MSFPRLLRRSGAVPALVRLIALLLGCISLVLLAGHGHPKVYTTDYLIVRVSHQRDIRSRFYMGR